MRNEIFKAARELETGEKVRLKTDIKSEELRRIRIFAEVAGWNIMCRTDKEDKNYCILFRMA